MATKNPPLRNALLKVQGTLYDGGIVTLETSRGKVACRLGLGTPAFGPPADGKMNISAPISGEALSAASEGITRARIDRGSFSITGLTVGPEDSGADIEMTNTSPEPGSTIVLEVLAFTEDDEVLPGS